jgi:glycosyltransferase involved in cell wall biosynthesis
MKALLVLNPRDTGGSERRAETWRSLLRHVDCDVIEHRLSLDTPSVSSVLRTARQVISGTGVPEAALLDVVTLGNILHDEAPDVLVLQTARVYSPDVATDAIVVLDFVDELSRSYEQRAASAPAHTRPLFKLLGATHRRFERRSAQRSEVIRVAAGRSCATALDATWIPNTIDEAPTPTTPWGERPFDLVFFGSLDYPPNIEALDFLAKADTTGLNTLVAGRQPRSAVKALCETNGWTLETNFESTASLAERARIAVAPLKSAVGIQNKVLEAAAHGLPQILTPATLKGLDPKFPAHAVSTPAELREAIDSLLSDPIAAEQLGLDAQRTVRQNFSTEAWADVVKEHIIGSSSIPLRR